MRSAARTRLPRPFSTSIASILREVAEVPPDVDLAHPPQTHPDEPQILTLDD